MSQTTVSLTPEPSLLDYTQGRRLGKGGQGVVHQYSDRRSGTIFAVKVIEYNIDELNPQVRPQSEINILREAYVSARLAHVGVLVWPVSLDKTKLYHRLTYSVRMQSSNMKKALQSLCLTFTGVVCDETLPVYPS